MARTLSGWAGLDLLGIFKHGVLALLFMVDVGGHVRSREISEPVAGTRVPWVNVFGIPKTEGNHIVGEILNVRHMKGFDPEWFEHLVATRLECSVQEEAILFSIPAIDASDNAMLLFVHFIIIFFHWLQAGSVAVGSCDKGGSPTGASASDTLLRSGSRLNPPTTFKPSAF